MKVPATLAVHHLYFAKGLAARHLYFPKPVLAARKKNLTTARARKNKHTARMLAKARKDHSIPGPRYASLALCTLSRLE